MRGGEGVRRASSSERGGEATNSCERSILSGAVPRSSPSTSDRPVSDLSKLRFLTSSSGRLLGFEPSFDRSSLVCVWSDSVPPRIFQARVVVRIRRDSSSPRGPRFPRVRSRRVRTATRARERRRPRRVRVGAWVRRGALVRASARVRAGPRHVSDDRDHRSARGNGEGLELRLVRGGVRPRGVGAERAVVLVRGVPPGRRDVPPGLPRAVPQERRPRQVRPSPRRPRARRRGFSRPRDDTHHTARRTADSARSRARGARPSPDRSHAERPRVTPPIR